MANDTEKNEPTITVDTRTDVVTIEIRSDFGPITFSYSPAAVDKGLAALVAEILRSSAGKNRRKASEHFGLPSDILVEAAAIYEERASQTFPQDAIEQFSAGSEAYANGTMEQFVDNLVPALLLMLDHLAATALVSASADSDPQWRRKVAKDREAIRALLAQQFSENIRALWPRLVPGATED